MLVTITNVSSQGVYISSLASALSVGGSVTTTRSLSELDADKQLRGLINEGSVTVSCTHEETSRECVTTVGAFTPATYDVWVDGSLGEDSNPGTAAAPLKTIQTALDMLPEHPLGIVTVRVKRGTYQEKLTLSVRLVHLAGARVVLQGEDWDAFVPSAGGSTGTFTSNSGNTITNAGKTWIANELRGSFVKVTSGPLNGKYIPIAANTGSAIELAFAGSEIGNATYELVRPAVKLVADTSSPNQNSCLFVNATGTSMSWSSAYPYAVRIVGIDFDHTGVNRALLVGIGGNVEVESCRFTGGGSFGIQKDGEGALAILHTFCAANASCYILSRASRIHLIDVVSSGGMFGFQFFSCHSIVVDPVFGIHVSAASSCGILMFSTGRLTANPIYLKGNVVGLGIDLFVSLEIDGAVISGNTSHGIQFLDGSIAASGGSGCSRLSLSGSSITGNGGDAIRVSSSHNNVEIDSCTITGNVGFGVNLGHTVYATHNLCVGSAAVTMGTNTAGDITLDGTSASTLAAWRVAGGKRLTDSDRFNIAVEV